MRVRREPHEHGQRERPARRVPTTCAPGARARRSAARPPRPCRAAPRRAPARAHGRWSSRSRRGAPAARRARRSRPAAQWPQWSSHGWSSSSASAPTPSAPAARPWFTATAMRPDESSMTTSLPLADVGERARVDRLAGAPARRAPRRSRRARSPAARMSSARRLSCRLPKRSTATTLRANPALGHLGWRQLQALKRIGIQRSPGVLERRAERQVRGDGREQVAAVKGRGHRLQPVRALRDVDRLHDSAAGLGGRPQQAVVGADEAGSRRVRAAPPPGARCRRPGRPPRGALPAGGKGIAFCSDSAPRRTSWRGTSCVTSITTAPGAIRCITPWQTPTNSSRVTVVGEERDRQHSGGRRGRQRVGAAAPRRGRRRRGARPRRAPRGRARAPSRS